LTSFLADKGVAILESTMNEVPEIIQEKTTTVIAATATTSTASTAPVITAAAATSTTSTTIHVPTTTTHTVPTTPTITPPGITTTATTHNGNNINNNPNNNQNNNHHPEFTGGSGSPKAEKIPDSPTKSFESFTKMADANVRLSESPPKALENTPKKTAETLEHNGNEHKPLETIDSSKNGKTNEFNHQETENKEVSPPVLPPKPKTDNVALEPEHEKHKTMESNPSMNHTNSNNTPVVNTTDNTLINNNSNANPILVGASAPINIPRKDSLVKPTAPVLPPKKPQSISKATSLNLGNIFDDFKDKINHFVEKSDNRAKSSSLPPQVSLGNVGVTPLAKSPSSVSN
jgi:hypothetical protein